MSTAAEPPAGIRNPVLRVLVYSHVWLALGAAAQTWWMQAMLSGEGWRAPALAFCGTIVLYTFMRLARMNHPELGTSVQMIWTRRNKRYLIIAATLCALLGALLAMPFTIPLVRSLWPAFLMAFFYVVPFGWTSGKTIGLRRVPGLKALLIAIVWAWTTVGLPMAMLGPAHFVQGVTPWHILQFAFFLSLAIAFDIRDMPYDPRSLRTVPQLFGLRWARIAGVFLQLPWLLLFVLGILLDQQSGEEPIVPAGTYTMRWLLPIPGILLSMGLIAVASPRRSELFYSIALDGMLILIPLLVWIGRIL